MAFFNKLFGAEEEQGSPQAPATESGSAPLSAAPPLDAAVSNPEPRESLLKLRQTEGPSLRALVIATALGPVDETWLDRCRESLTRIKRAAEYEQAESFLQSADRLEQWFDSQAMGLPSRPGLKQLFQYFEELLPGERTLYEEICLRDQLLVENLLRQVPGVNKPLLDKLEASGLWSVHELAWLDVNAAAKRCELSREDEKRCLSQIRLCVLTHLEGRKRLQPAETSPGFRTALLAATQYLGAQEAAFEQAQQNEDKQAIRAARNARRLAGLQLNVLLIEAGQLQEVEAQERMSITERLARLRAQLSLD